MEVTPSGERTAAWADSRTLGQSGSGPRVKPFSERKAGLGFPRALPNCSQARVPSVSRQRSSRPGRESCERRAGPGVGQYSNSPFDAVDNFIFGTSFAAPQRSIGRDYASGTAVPRASPPGPHSELRRRDETSFGGKALGDQLRSAAIDPMRRGRA